MYPIILYIHIQHALCITVTSESFYNNQFNTENKREKN